MEKIVKELYERYSSKDLDKMSKRELLELIEKELDTIDAYDLRGVVRKQRQREYEAAYREYVDKTSASVEEILALAELFEQHEDKREALLPEIAKALRAQKGMLISRSLPYKLVCPILYALDKKDLETSALLMERRIQMEKDGSHYGDIRYRPADHIDRMDLLDKFVGLVAQQCDKEQADKYIAELGQGKYTSLMRVIDGHYYYVGEGYIRELYEEAKVGTQQKPTKEKGREF